MRYPGHQVDLVSPVEWAHPLNRDRRLWLLGLPGQARGGAWRDLARGRGVSLTAGADWVPTSRRDDATRRPSGFGDVLFNGTAAYASGPCSLNAGTGDFTVSCWFYATSGPSGYLFTAGGSGEITAYMDGLYHPALFIADAGGHFHQLTYATAQDNAWHHFAGVKAGSVVTALYLDGLPRTTVPLSSGTVGSVDPTTLYVASASGSSNFLGGRVCDVSLWNRAFTADQVWELYQASRNDYPGALRRLPGVRRFLTAAAPAAWPAILLA